MTIIAVGVGLATGASACSGLPSDPQTSTLDSELRSLAPREIVGRLAYGQTSVGVLHTGTPRYRAFAFDGEAGDQVEAWVKSDDGHATAFLLGPTFNTLDQNAASKVARDSRVAATLKRTGTHYIAFRDSDLAPATFRVTLLRTNGPSPNLGSDAGDASAQPPPDRDSGAGDSSSGGSGDSGKQDAATGCSSQNNLCISDGCCRSSCLWNQGDPDCAPTRLGADGQLTALTDARSLSLVER